MWSLPTSYKHLLPTLMYGNETMDLEEITSTPRLEEKRLNGGSNEASNDSALTVGYWKKNNSKNESTGCVDNQGTLKGIVRK